MCKELCKGYKVSSGDYKGAGIIKSFLGTFIAENFFLYMVVFSSFFKTSKDDLLLTDFEGALKFFRVQLPKRYRSEENAKKLMELACNMKVKSCLR